MFSRVRKKQPDYINFAGAVYMGNKYGSTLRQLEKRLGIPYDSLNKRASRLVNRCGSLIRVEVIGKKNRYFKTQPMTKHQVRQHLIDQR